MLRPLAFAAKYCLLQRLATALLLRAESTLIYGTGHEGAYDFGPLGVELKNNLKAAWWRSLVHERDDIEGLDASILTHREVLRHSGHEETFTDPLVDCRACKSRFRADHIEDGICPNCGSTRLTPPRRSGHAARHHSGFRNH